MSSQPATYTVKEAAAIVGISEWAVYQAVGRGEFPHLRVGNRIIIPKRRFEAWLDGKADWIPESWLTT